MKKLILISIIILSITLLTSCSHIKDTNGDENYTLCEITDSDITGNFSFTNNVGRIRTSLNGRGKITVNKFSGIETVESLSLENDTLIANVSVKVESGNFRVVIIKDNGIIKDFIINQENQQYTLNNQTGKFKLVVVGESAKYTIEYQFHKE